jgi:IS30 family transposase
MKPDKTKHKIHHRLNYNDRIYIQHQLSKESVINIAKMIGVSRSTIYKELKRGTVNGIYDAEYAQKNLYK